MIEICNRNGWTALHFAAFNGHKKTAVFLLEKGANCNAQDQNGWTPLMCASYNGKNQTLHSIIDKSSNLDINCRDAIGTTALMWACQNGHLNAVKILLQIGNANIAVEDENGWTALAWAKACQRISVISYLQKIQKMQSRLNKQND